MVSRRRKHSKWTPFFKPLSLSAVVHVSLALIAWIVLWPTHHSFKRPQVSASIGTIDVSGMDAAGRPNVAHSEARRAVRADQVVSQAAGEISSPRKMVMDRKFRPLESGTASEAQAKLGGGQASAFQAYLSDLVKRIESKKVYPDEALSREEEGKVVVTIVLDPDGTIFEARVTESSRFRALNQAALQTLRQVGKLPPLPEGFSRIRLQIPMVFQIQRG